ncbi:MAG: thiamine diphosphokinase [Paracoccaceae bacterium]
MQFSENVTLLGASKVKLGVLTEALTFAPRLVAADGGAKIAVKIGQMPDFVVGDLDSIDPQTLAQIPKNRLVRVSEQETTDFEKCLTVIDAPVILGVGFLGRRVDHQLAAFNALIRHAHKPVVLINKRDLCFHLPADITLPLERGTRVSLFPMAPVTGRSEGLRWPIDGIAFAPDGRIGTSNIADGGTVRLNMDGPGMLAIMPRAALAQVVRALAR